MVLLYIKGKNKVNEGCLSERLIYLLGVTWFKQRGNASSLLAFRFGNQCRLVIQNNFQTTSSGLDALLLLLRLLLLLILMLFQCAWLDKLGGFLLGSSR